MEKIMDPVSGLVVWAAFFSILGLGAAFFGVFRQLRHHWTLLVYVLVVILALGVLVAWYPVKPWEFDTDPQTLEQKAWIGDSMAGLFAGGGLVLLAISIVFQTLELQMNRKEAADTRIEAREMKRLKDDEIALRRDAIDAEEQFDCNRENRERQRQALSNRDLRARCWPLISASTFEFDRYEGIRKQLSAWIDIADTGQTAFDFTCVEIRQLPGTPAAALSTVGFVRKKSDGWSETSLWRFTVDDQTVRVVIDHKGVDVQSKAWQIIVVPAYRTMDQSVVVTPVSITSTPPPTGRLKIYLPEVEIMAPTHLTQFTRNMIPEGMEYYCP